MAKLECRLKGSFYQVLSEINDAVMSGSFSANLENGSDYSCGGVVVAVRVFERYSMVGQNRVSLNITLIGSGDDLFLSAISSGGSQAMMFKLNTFGEEAFLNTITNVVAKYRVYY
jgi:hypothetical protein